MFFWMLVSALFWFHVWCGICISFGICCLLCCEFWCIIPGPQVNLDAGAFWLLQLEGAHRMHHLRSASRGTPGLLRGSTRKVKHRSYVSFTFHWQSSRKCFNDCWMCWTPMAQIRTEALVDCLTIQRCRTPQEYAMAFWLQRFMVQNWFSQDHFGCSFLMFWGHITTSSASTWGWYCFNTSSLPLLEEHLSKPLLLIHLYPLISGCWESLDVIWCIATRLSQATQARCYRYPFVAVELMTCALVIAQVLGGFVFRDSLTLLHPLIF